MNAAWTEDTSGVLPQVANGNKNKYTCQTDAHSPYKSTLLYKNNFNISQVLSGLQNMFRVCETNNSVQILPSTVVNRTVFAQ